MKILLLILLLLNVSTVCAQDWVNAKNQTNPIIFLDKDSIYSVGSKYVYNKNHEDTAATAYADFYENDFLNTNKIALLENSSSKISYMNSFDLGNPKGSNRQDENPAQWRPYMHRVESKIKRNWYPPKGDKSKSVVLLFKLAKSGDLISVRVSKSSGSKEVDRAAIIAIRKSAPFGKFPKGIEENIVEIEFTFDYNVIGPGYR